LGFIFAEVTKECMNVYSYFNANDPSLEAQECQKINNR